jgi:ClpP class serine protease
VGITSKGGKVSEVIEQLIGKIVVKLFTETAKGGIYAAVAEAMRGLTPGRGKSLSEEDIRKIARIIAEVSRGTAQPVDEAKLREIIRSELQRALGAK